MEDSENTHVGAMPFRQMVVFLANEISIISYQFNFIIIIIIILLLL